MFHEWREGDDGNYQTDSALFSRGGRERCTGIGEDAFCDCDGLSSVTISDSVTSIGAYAFSYNDNLSGISFRGPAPEIATSAFYGNTITIYYPENDVAWTSVMSQNYGGKYVEWVAYGCEHGWGSYYAVVTAPDCENGGYTTYTCSVCGDTYIGDETEARGHTAGEAVKENETATSYESVVYCSACGHEISRETVETGPVQAPNATIDLVGLVFKDYIGLQCAVNKNNLNNGNYDKDSASVVITTQASLELEGHNFLSLNLFLNVSHLDRLSTAKWSKNDLFVDLSVDPQNQKTPKS